MPDPRPTIHIIDDEESVRASLAFMLEIAGFTVATYPSAEAFLHVPRDRRTGCLITDLGMPDIDGIELLRRLRAEGSPIPAIIITGHGDTQKSVEAVRSGAVDFIEKPFDEPTILAAIAHAMQRDSELGRATQRLDAARRQVESLSPPDRKMLAALASGRPVKSIAADLKLDRASVEALRTALMARLGARSVAELIAFAIDVNAPPADQSEEG